MTPYRLKQHDDLGILRLRAGNANAMNTRVLTGLAAGLNEARAANLKGLILTGDNGFFSAGLDLIEVYAFDREQMRRFIAHWENTMIELFAFPLPVVAAINGAAAAGGCLMALACDYRVMAEDAAIGMTGIRLGISLPAAALEIARDGIPAPNLTHVLYSGKLFKSDKARELGLVNAVVRKEELMDVALKMLREFTQHHGNPINPIKTALRQSTLTRIRQSAEALQEKFLDFWFSPVAQKGIAEMRNELLSRKNSKSEA